MTFTPTVLLASAADLLISAGYRAASIQPDRAMPFANGRVFEDAYCLVAVISFDTSSELLEKWPDAQSWLIDLVSRRLNKAEPKAWDCYLVLLTSAFTDTDRRREISAIRYDTTRLRKLVATGEELHTLDDVKRTMLPLLPVSTAVVGQPTDVLELLVDVLAERGIDRGDLVKLAAAFSRHEALMPTLYRGADAP